MIYVIEGIGILGALAILIAYALNSYQKISSSSTAFYLLNLVGGGLLIIYSIYKEAWANIVINVVWVLVAIIALARYFAAKQKRNT